nr:spermatogenesis-associated protein 33 [Dromaius novaehollandiae]
MGRAFSRAAHAGAGGQRGAAGSQDEACGETAPTGGHDPHGVASELSVTQSSRLSAEGPHQKGEKAAEKKKPPVPKIVITGPSEDSASLTSLKDLPEPRAIRDVANRGPYRAHRQPSTVEAYRSPPRPAAPAASETGN